MSMRTESINTLLKLHDLPQQQIVLICGTCIADVQNTNEHEKSSVNIICLKNIQVPEVVQQVIRDWLSRAEELLPIFFVLAHEFQ